MLWIRDILVRIRIRGSVLPLTNGSGSGSGSWSCYFRLWPSRRQQKTILFLSFSVYYLLFEGTFTSFFWDKKSWSYKKVRKESRFFLLFLLDDRRIRIPDPYLWQTDPDPEGPKNIRIRIPNPGCRYIHLFHLIGMVPQVRASFTNARILASSLLFSRLFLAVSWGVYLALCRHIHLLSSFLSFLALIAHKHSSSSSLSLFLHILSQAFYFKI